MAQITDLSIIIGRCSLDNQQAGFSQHPVNVGCSNFRYTNNDQGNHSMDRYQWKNEPKNCYNQTEIGNRKRMIEIWTESTGFNTSQRFADQARIILKKV